MFWPTPYLMTTQLHLGGDDGTHIVLPLAPPGDERVPGFRPAPVAAAASKHESQEAGTSSGYGEIESVDRNPQTGDALAVASNRGVTRYPWGTETYRERIEHRTSDRHPETTSVTSTYEIKIELENRVLLLEGKTTFSSDLDNFYYQYTRSLRENGQLVRTRTWAETFLRDYQ
jgi:hypothetical protein